MKKITTLITILILSLFAALSARANLIWYEGFQYTNGSIAVTTNIFVTLDAVTNSVSRGLWLRPAPFNGSANPDDMYVVNSNLQVAATGGSAISRQDDDIRYFATTNGTTTNNFDLIGTYTNTSYNHEQLLYASFTVICSTTISNGAGLPNGAGSYFASFYSNTNYGMGSGVFGEAGTNANGYGYFGRVQAFTNLSVLANTWRLGVTDNAKGTNALDGGWPGLGPGWPSGGGLDLAVNTPYQVVEELDPITLDAATIWVNPININQSGASPVDPVYTASDAMGGNIRFGVNSYAFRQGSSFGNAAFIISNLAVATTFAEAATNVMATNAVNPVIVYQPQGVANFVGSVFSLSALANGQGLGSMTYQWQVSATTNANGTLASPVNVSGGNFSGINGNILNDNNAQLGDTGYYDLIATTPWGLSATSAVAYVSVTLAKVPPVFVTEPVSLTVYRGQTVTFTTSVESPGNVTFTWYSNNVALVGANVSSAGDSSSLTLGNVTTDCSAAYSVAATNDYTGFPTNGVVSTNGVLTVLNPPVVSIAYLRSLQDPNAGYVPTVPVTQPFQVTGTVTTYTNVTTGNTSSYYLQDGTAGINIFATQPPPGAPLFRPQQGDVVTYVGVVSQFGTGFELYADTADSLYPYTSWVDTGTTAPLPAPISIPMNFVSAYGLPYVNTNIGGSLVQLSDVYFGARAGTTINGGANDVIAVTNSMGQTCNVEFFDLDDDTTNQTLPSYAFTVTGVLYGDNATWAVGVTRFADIVTTPVAIPLNASVSGGNIIITWSGSAFQLQSAPSPAGPWTTIPLATSPYSTSTSGSPMFFRLYYNPG